MSPADLRTVAIRAAEAGVAAVLDFRARAAALDVESKGIGDYVTAADREAEAAVLAVLAEATPDIAVLAEESGGVSGDRVWVVDPVDGTTNFLRGFPIVGVSVGLLEEGMPVAGAVAAPELGRLWSAARGQGAHDRDGRRLRVRPAQGAGVVATGFPFRRPDNLARYRPVLDRSLTEFEDLRRAGAASLDLAFSAAGVFDGYFELGLSPWDVAAGGLLVLEAGGVVTDWSGDARAIYATGDVLAGAPEWHERMLDMVLGAGIRG
ncbi:MAG: inositol monophosphatase [Candidatus Dormibacteria bacterium]